MADHNLRITAQLDTSDLNAELDRLNQQRGGGGTNDTTGNGISLGMRLRQLQLSLDNLNRTLQNMMRQVGRDNQQARSGNSRLSDGSLTGFLGSAQEKNIKADIQRLGARAIASGDIVASKWRSTSSREAWLETDQGAKYRDEYNRLQGKNTRLDNYNAEMRGAKMGLAIGGHFASMIGSSLQEAGYQRAGGAMNIVGGMMGGAASGAFGGPVGMAIGALVGGAATAASEIKRMSDASEQAAAALERLKQQSETQLFKYGQTRDIDWANKRAEDNWMNIDELQRTQLFAQGRVDFFKRQLEGEDGKGGMYAELRKLQEDIENGNIGAEKGQTQKRVLELLPQIKEMESLMDQWSGVVGDFQKRMDAIDPYSNENHEKWLEAQLALETQAAETRAKNEETRKQLLQEREQILLGIEQEYAQQGVDILSGMGKSGKYMSQAEAASTSQERYAPITKKLDTMQKSLDHLSQIDSKLRNLNIGLI